MSCTRRPEFEPPSRRCGVLAALLLWQVAPASLGAAEPASALAEEIQPIYVGAFGAGQPLAFPVDQDFLPGDLLLLEGTDLSDWARVENGLLRVELPIELDEGEYELDWQRDGELLGSFRFRVGQPASELRGSYGGFVSLELSQRFADQSIASDAPHRTQLRGSADVFGRIGAGEFDRWPYQRAWQLDAQLPVFYDRVGSEGPGRHAWGLGDFLANARYGPVALRAGHFVPASSSLILEGFSRRGASASLDLSPLRTTITGFAVRAEPITGFQEGLGLRDRQQRVYGASVETRPIEGDWIELDLVGTYLRGRGSLGGVGVDGEFVGELRSGTAWSGVADLQLWQRRIRVRGEYARTIFNRDVLGDERPRRDEGYSVLASFTPWLDATLLGRSFRTTLSFEGREVGPAFESLANPLAPIDRELKQWVWDAQWGGFSGRFSFAREKDNVDHRPELPRFRTDLFDGDLGWRGAFPSEDAPWYRQLVGAPFVGIGWSRERLKPIRGVDARGLVEINLFPFAEVVVPSIPALGVIPVVLGSTFGTPFDPSVAPFEQQVLDDRSIRTSRIQFGTQYARWGWSASHMVRRLEDRTRRDPDTRTDLTSFDLNFELSEGSRMNIGYQRQRDKQEDRGFQTTTVQGRAGLQLTWIPDRLSGGFDVVFSRSRDSRFTDLTTWTATSFIDWTLRRPRGFVPGILLSLNGSFQDVQDDVFRAANGNQYQAFLTATIWWEKTE